MAKSENGMVVCLAMSNKLVSSTGQMRYARRFQRNANLCTVRKSVAAFAHGRGWSRTSPLEARPDRSDGICWRKWSTLRCWGEGEAWRPSEFDREDDTIAELDGGRCQCLMWGLICVNVDDRNGKSFWGLRLKLSRRLVFLSETLVLCSYICFNRKRYFAIL